MRNPIIVESGERKQGLEVYDASVTLSIIPLSTATLTLPAGTTFPSRTYVEMFTENGSAGIFRTRSPRIGIGNSTQVDLEHAIADLGDYLIAESYEKEMTMTNAVKEVFKYYKGSNWKLGTVAKGSTKVVLDTEYDSVLDALLALMEQEPSLMMTFNFSGFPWVMNLEAKPTAISAEGRLSRNVKSATITTDDTDLCTRVYMEELPGTKDNVYGHLDATTIGKYGVIEKEISGSGYTQEQAKRAAQLYLDKHKEPSITIQIDAIDLSKITGESLDTFQIGKKMRLALPDYGITKEETITQMVWSSLFGSPNSVTITLAEEEDTVLLAVNTQAKTAQKTASRTSKKTKKSIEYVVDEDGNVTPKSIADAMNKDKETRIDGKRVYIGDKDSVTVINGKCTLDQVSATYISSKIAGIKDLHAHNIHADDYLISGTSGMGELSLKNAITNARIVSIGNVYRLQVIRANNPSKWIDIDSTFSRAVTALNGSWSGGIYTVTPTPQGSPSHKITLRDQVSDADAWIDIKTTGTPTVMSTNNKWIEATMRFVSRDKQGQDTNRGDAFTMGFNATAVWNLPTVTSIGLAENLDPIDTDSTDYRSNVYIQADVSNGNKKDDKLLVLGSTTDGDGNYCVNLRDGSSIIGRISVQNRYTKGRNDTKIGNPTWSPAASSSPSTNHNKVTFSTDAPTAYEKSADLYIYADGWKSGSNAIYMSHTDTSTQAYRIAKLSVSIPTTTVKDEIYTYGNTYPTSINGGKISKSGITAGKYMVCTTTCGGKDVNIRFQVTA